MFPEAIRVKFEFVSQALTAFILDQTLTFGRIIDDNDPQVGIYCTFPIPIAARRADLDFGRNNKFFAHNRFRSLLCLHGSKFFANGSMKFIA
jgi:hypothetical protein